MMLSVLQNTKSPVKFWFLKNYLSPSFKVTYTDFSDHIMCTARCVYQLIYLDNVLQFVYKTIYTVTDMQVDITCIYV